MFKWLCPIGHQPPKLGLPIFYLRDTQTLFQYIFGEYREIGFFHIEKSQCRYCDFWRQGSKKRGYDGNPFEIGKISDMGKVLWNRVQNQCRERLQFDMVRNLRKDCFHAHLRKAFLKFWYMGLNLQFPCAYLLMNRFEGGNAWMERVRNLVYGGIS